MNPPLPTTPAGEALAGLLLRLDPEHGPALRQVVTDLVAALARQQPCLPAPSDPAIAAALAKSPLVSRGDGAFRPLILDAGLLYLHRYWEQETRLAARLRALAAAEPSPPPPPNADARVDALFAGADPEAVRGQKSAVTTALDKSLLLLAGGPGTGKTHTVSNALAALAASAPTGGAPLRIALAAPTGKAAQRLTESLGKGGAPGASPDASGGGEPLVGVTLHRLLGARPDCAPRHHAGNPLPYDVVVVDEASMIDLVLMAQLVDAMPAGARLLLLGDPDQLASVEVGSVFGDLVAAAAAGGPLAGNLVRLRHTFRFTGALAAACSALREGNTKALFETLRAGEPLTWRQISPADPLTDCPAAEALANALEAPAPEDVLAGLSKARLLTPFHRGPVGVDQLAALAARRFPASGRTPVLVTRNAPDRGLFNGDVGFLDAASGLAWFPDPHGGRPRSLPAVRLPPVETAWALTVHRSQGSEFDVVHLFLPGRDHPILTRELLYTAFSRARKAVFLDGPAEVLAAALARRATRPSGLTARLA